MTPHYAIPARRRGATGDAKSCRRRPEGLRACARAMPHTPDAGIATNGHREMTAASLVVIL